GAAAGVAVGAGAIGVAVGRARRIAVGVRLRSVSGSVGVVGGPVLVVVGTCSSIVGPVRLIIRGSIAWVRVSTAGDDGDFAFPDVDLPFGVIGESGETYRFSISWGHDITVCGSLSSSGTSA